MRGTTWWYVLRVVFRKIVDVAIVLWIAATLAFLLLQIMPGNPVDNLLSGSFEVTEEMRRQITQAYGLDRPIWEQYLLYLSRLVVGDLGTSYQLRQPVIEVIAAQALPTVQLAALAMTFAVAIAVLGPVLTTVRNPFVREGAKGLEIVAASVPSFWTGMILLAIFSYQLRWFPASGADGFVSLVLPALTLAIPISGTMSQVVRERIDHTLTAPHVVTARARGISELRVRTHHALRHSLLPLLTLSGSIIGSLLGGTVVIETLFSRPGLGRVTLQAISSKDIPVIMGIVVLAALIFVFVNMIVDLTYRFADPRTVPPRAARVPGAVRPGRMPDGAPVAPTVQQEPEGVRS